MHQHNSGVHLAARCLHSRTSNLHSAANLTQSFLGSLLSPSISWILQDPFATYVAQCVLKLGQSMSWFLQDPFGNYVVQYVLELGHVEATATIMRQLYDHYPEQAQQKFSSNVVEKCLKLGGPGLAECRERVIRELMVSPLLPRLLQVNMLVYLAACCWSLQSIVCC